MTSLQAIKKLILSNTCKCKTPVLVCPNDLGTPKLNQRIKEISASEN